MLVRRDYIQSKYFENWYKNTIVLLIKYTIFTMLIRLGLKIIGFNQLIKLLRQSQYSKIKYELISNQDILLLKKLIKPLFDKIKRAKFLNCNCLSSSILLWHILAKQGLETHIIIGTAISGTLFKAHAWVEYQSVPLNDKEYIRRHYCVFDHSFH